jgi:murein DD-endopeptidase MepM/ murein hydrolase activator NlpD
MEAERVTIELLAKVDGFDGKVKQSASSFGGAMSTIEASAGKAEKAVEALLSAQKAGSPITSKMIQDVGGLARAEQLLASAFDKTGAAAQRSTALVATQGTAVERSSRSAQQATRNLGYQISDISTQLSMGTSPFLILAQQGPQVANALDGAKGAVGRFAAFLSGPWGAALLGAITVLGVFISKNRETGDEVDDLVEKFKKQAEEAKNTAEAEEIFARTLEGVEKALRDNADALDKMRGPQRTAAEEALANAEAAKKQAIQIRNLTVALLENAQAQLEAASAPGLVTPGSGGASAAQSLFIRKVAELEERLKRARAALSEAQSQVIDAQSFVAVEQAAKTAEDRVNDLYDAQIERARKAAVASGTVASALKKEVEEINRAREAELKRLRETERERRRTGESAEQTRFISPVEGRTSGRFGERRGNRGHGGIDFAVPVGTSVKSAAAGTVITSANLPGYGNVLIVDHGGGTTTRYAHLSRMLAKQGDVVGQGQVIGLSGGQPGAPGAGNSKGPHLHYEVRRGGKAVDPSKGVFPTDTLAVTEKSVEALEREIEAELRRVQSFQNELANLQSSEIDARQALIDSAEELARLELEAIELSRQKYDDNLNSLVEQKKLTADEADQLRGINDERAKLRSELVKRREDQRKFRMEEADRQREAEFSSEQRANLADILAGQADLARTQAERRDLERRLLDLQFAEEKARNDYIIAFADRLRTQKGTLESEQREADAAAKIAKLRNESLGARKANAEQRTDRQTQGPLEGFFDSIPSDAAEINEALEAVAAGGLATFTDALTDAIVNFRSLKDVGLATLQALTAGLVRMAIEQVILRTIGQAAGSAAVAATTAQAAAAGAAWAGPAALASLATLGANAGPAALALTSTTALATALGAVPRKEGGPIFGPGGPRDDKVLMAASPGEYVIKAKSAARLGRKALDFINNTGALPGFRDGGFVAPRNGRAAGRSSEGIPETALRRIEDAVSRAAEAMPNVNLYPTLSPKAAMEAMLSDPGAQRVLFGFMRQNSGKMSSSLAG